MTSAKTQNDLQKTRNILSSLEEDNEMHRQSIISLYTQAQGTASPAASDSTDKKESSFSSLTSLDSMNNIRTPQSDIIKENWMAGGGSVSLASSPAKTNLNMDKLPSARTSSSSSGRLLGQAKLDTIKEIAEEEEKHK